MTTGQWQDSPLAPQARSRMKAWDLTEPVLLATTRMGMVLQVRCPDGAGAVLKCLSRTGRREEGTAAAALAAFDGFGAVRVLQSAGDALLMEYCTGEPLHEAPEGETDAAALPVIRDVVKRLHRRTAPPPQGIPALASRCRALSRGLGIARDTRTRALLARAMRLADELLEDPGEPQLLHGDLHHENILRTRRGGSDIWLAIDPQPMLGDAAYEVANIFGNPLGQTKLVLDPARPARLADRFSGDLGLERTRVLRWAFVHSCISAAWSLEVGDDPSLRLAIADTVAAHL